MERIKNRFITRLTPEQAIYSLTALVLVTSLLATIFAWQGQQNRLKEEGESNFRTQVETVTAALNQRITAYEEILRGSGAFIQTSESISFTNWQNFMEVSGAVSRYPGTHTIGYIPIVNKDRIDEHTSLGDLLIPYDYDVKNANSDLEFIAPLFYIEPLSEQGRNFLGYDFLSSDSTKAAMLEARRSGEIQVSKAVSLDVTKPDEKNGLLIILPIRATTENFEGEIVSQDNVMGYVFLALNTREIFSDVKDRNSTDTFGFKVSGNPGSSTELITSTPSYDQINQQGVALSSVKTVEAANLGWEIEFVANEMFNRNSNTLLPAYVLAGGIALSVLFSGIFLYANLQRYEMLQRAKHEEIASAKRDMVALTSHQLRTPATAVKQYISMILQGYAGEIANKEQQRFLESAYESNEHQLETINELLLVAKADARQLKLEYGEFDIVKLIKTEIGDQKSTFDERDQTIKYSGPKSLKLTGDKKMIRIIVENLISNASKYSNLKGKINVRIRSEGRNVEISVEDNGVGIESDDFTKLFKKFSRIENRLSKRVGGSGIGLYLSKQLAELHGGDIAVKSTHGKGSKFILILPKKIK